MYNYVQTVVIFLSEINKRFKTSDHGVPKQPQLKS